MGFGMTRLLASDFMYVFFLAILVCQQKRSMHSTIVVLFWQTGMALKSAVWLQRVLEMTKAALKTFAICLYCRQIYFRPFYRDAVYIGYCIVTLSWYHQCNVLIRRRAMLPLRTLSICHFLVLSCLGNQLPSLFWRPLVILISFIF